MGEGIIRGVEIPFRRTRVGASVSTLSATLHTGVRGSHGARTTGSGKACDSVRGDMPCRRAVGMGVGDVVLWVFVPYTSTGPVVGEVRSEGP